MNQVKAYEYPGIYFYDARQDSPYIEQLMKMPLTKFALAINNKKLNENFPAKSAT